MKKIFNISNGLSLFRLVIAPVIMFLIIFDKMYFALVLFILAALTDFLDGYASRKFKKETKIGDLLDKLSDKLLLGFIILGFIIKYNAYWSLFVLILVVASYIAGFHYFIKYKYRATLLGKINVWLQAITIVAFMIDFEYKFYLFWIVVIITAYVGLSYVYRILKKSYKK